MFLDGWHGGQRAVDGFTGRVVLHVAVRLAPAERGPHELANPPRTLRDGGPHRGKDSEHIFPRHQIHALVADAGIDVLGKLPVPYGFRLVVPPARPRGVLGLFGRFPERWHRHLTSFREGVTAAPRNSPVVKRLLSRLIDAHQREAAKPAVSLLTLNRQPLNPLP